MVKAAASEAVQWMLDNRSLALPARVFRLKDVLDAMPEWLQRMPGTRKATVEALRDHFKAKQWPVPIRPDGRNGDQFVPWLHPDVAWANLETGDVREMYKADRAKAKEAASKRRRRRRGDGRWALKSAFLFRKQPIYRDRSVTPAQRQLPTHAPLL